MKLTQVRNVSDESSSEDESNSFRARIDSQGRMMRFRYGIDHKVDQDDLVGSLRKDFYVHYTLTERSICSKI